LAECVRCGSLEFSVFQLGPDAIKGGAPDDVPPDAAALDIAVDGRSHRHAIRVLPGTIGPKWIPITT
jgi:hypothetical protein